MKKCIELKYHKNSKQEIVFENLDEIRENDNVILMLEDGNINPLIDVLYILKENNELYISYPLTLKQYLFLDNYAIDKDCKKINLFDNLGCTLKYQNGKIVDNINNILPKWNIRKDGAILFLNEKDYEKYEKLANAFHSKDGTSFIYSDLDGYIQGFNKVSIILHQLHAEDKYCPYHIENINKIYKELKEEYGIKKIQLFVSHCFLANNDSDLTSNNDNLFDQYIGDDIDKITTTNSTGILKVQKSDRLEVIDVVEFFKD